MANSNHICLSRYNRKARWLDSNDKPRLSPEDREKIKLNNALEASNTRNAVRTSQRPGELPSWYECCTRQWRGQSRLMSEFAMSLDHVMPVRLSLLLDKPTVPTDISVEHTWNPNDASRNIMVKEGDCHDEQMTIYRHPIPYTSTDGIRGKVGYSQGMHVWEIIWPHRQRENFAVVGVATKDAPLQTRGYKCLVGGNNQSWGWELANNKLFHNVDINYEHLSKGTQYPSKLYRDAPNLFVPDNFLVILDMDLGTLAFVVEGQYLGVAFTGLKGKTLYPMVSAVWEYCEVTMTYLGGLDPGPIPMMDLCRKVIRQSVGEQRLTRIPELGLPKSINQDLMLPSLCRRRGLYDNVN